MTLFRINLIQNVVPSSRSRMRLFLGLVGYLALSGVGLAMLAGYVFDRVRDRLEIIRRLDIQEQKFRELYPDVTNLRDYSGDLRATLGRNRDQIALIRKTLSQRVALAPTMLTLFGPLSNGMRVLSLTFDRDKKVLTFDISVPVPVYEGQFRNDTLLSAWNQNTEILQYAKSVVLVGTRRDRVGDHMAFILTFQCVLKDTGR